MAALVIAMIAALAYAILRTGDDPRSNGITPSGTAPEAEPGRAEI
jgi:hypothetical protein